MINRPCLHNINSLFYCISQRPLGLCLRAHVPSYSINMKWLVLGIGSEISLQFVFILGLSSESGVIRPWALASKQPFTYYCSYSKRLGHGLILKGADQASELLFHFFFLLVQIAGSYYWTLVLVLGLSIQHVGQYFKL